MLELLGHTPETLHAALTARGADVPPGACRRALADLVALGRPAPLPRDGYPKGSIDVLRSLCTWERPAIEARFTDAFDGSVRYLFRLGDGAVVEAVRIPLHKAGRFSVCLSSQVGCAMGCTFCATGRLGLTRNLRPAEMIGAFLQVRDEAPGRVTGAVFMGQGEPFHNYEAVVAAASVLSDPNGGRVTAKSITVSTVGLVPAIRRYAAERRPWRLIVSLTSAIPERRAALLPVAGRSTLEDLAGALREYAAVAPGRVTVAWVLIGGLNTGPDEAEALARLVGDLPLRVNLVDVNDPRPEGFRRATDAERRRFMEALQVLRVPIVRRYSVGAGQNGACGMLAGVAGGAAALPPP